jgi:phosphoglycerate dehydrogenase-like enzyme
MNKIAILDDYQNAALSAADWGRLSNAQVTVFNDFIPTESLAKCLSSFHILVLMRERTPMPKVLIDKLRNLKLIVTAGLRNRSIDMEAARSAGIDVCGTEMLGYPAFEHTWGLILALTKKIPFEDQVMKNGGWQQGFGIGLNGKTLGLVGLGKLGAKVAKVGLAFDMRVIAWSQNLADERANELGVERVSKDVLFKSADLISIHLVLSDRTTNLVGEAELKQMKSTAYLINTSRGPIINEQALIKALRSGAIAGAALDVFDTEPLPIDHTLRQLKNIILTGHTGFVVKELHQKVYQQAVEGIQSWLKGTPVRLLNGLEESSNV